MTRLKQNLAEPAGADDLEKRNGFVLIVVLIVREAAVEAVSSVAIVSVADESRGGVTAPGECFGKGGLRGARGRSKPNESS